MYIHVGRVGHATKNLQPTAPVLKAGHPVSYSFVACLFVSWDRGFLGFFLLLSVSLLVYYTHIIPRTCMSIIVNF